MNEVAFWKGASLGMLVGSVTTTLALIIIGLALGL